MPPVRAVYCRSGYSQPRLVNYLEGWYRDLTCRELKVGYKGEVYAMNRHGNVVHVRQSGAIKTWKRTPGAEAPFKYGLYENFRVGGKDVLDDSAISQEHQVRVVVRVTKEFLADTPAEIVTNFVLEMELGI